MVGRDDELHTVEQALNAARTGRGGAVFVTGVSGIGKSRLAAVAADLAFAANMVILRGRGSPVGPIVPYWSLTQALMSLLRANPAFDVTELGPYRPILARLLPDLGPPAGGGDGGSLAVLAEAVLRLTGLAGRERGCLLILDDMQDADAETLAVAEYLAGNLEQQPVVLLGTVRSDPCPALELATSAAQRDCATLIELHRLSAPQVRRLAGSCLGADETEVPEQAAEHLWVGSAGIPLLAEELLSGMLSDGLLARGDAGWLVDGRLGMTVPVTLARAVSGQLDRIGAQGRELLSVAAVLGRRFPLTVLQAATGLSDRALLSHLHAEITTRLVAPDEETPDWYAFQHPLVVDVLLSLLTPAQRAQYAKQAAGALEDAYPGLPEGWCQVCATLLLQAGEPTRAARLFAEAGHRALAQGAASSAVTLLDRALELLTEDDDQQVRADAFADLLLALAEAGLVERALNSASELEQLAGLLSPQSRARLHTRVAWAAVVAGRSADGLAQVGIARRLVGPDAGDRATAPIDVVEAHLVLDEPGPGQIERSESLARRAAAVAEAAELPVAACQAWQLLGAVSRSRDPDGATACLERARQIAVRHHLKIEEIHALVRLGSDDSLRDGSLARLEQASREAARSGAVSAGCLADASIALQAVLRGEFATAQRLLGQVLEATMRLKLVETTQYALLVRAILGAHRGRRREMDAALADLRQWDGYLAQNTPRVYGLARAWCALLEENRPRALRELSVALAAEDKSPSIFQLTGRYGLDLLLRVLDRTADRATYQTETAVPVSRLRWNRQFTLFADAVLAGREGQPAAAGDAVAEAVRAGAPYPTGRHLGLRLVSEAAVTDGWGTPADWLRTAEEYFHGCDVAPVASACRALLRQVGAPVAQHRTGHQDIPSPLRSVGVTVREHEVLQLLAGRLSNREIASRLHLSPRTVEKHVASLLTKTGQPDRIALGEFGSTTLL
ncbi:MAG TPA: AAA family ATPase [Streptosporangiaceae bacterium]|jgi:DNA-binding CsgD family transcriptional regulator